MRVGIQIGWGAGIVGLVATALLGCGDIEPLPPRALTSGAGGAPPIFVTTDPTPDAGTPAPAMPDAGTPPPITGCSAMSGKGGSSGCAGGTVCDPVTGTCVECLTDSDCKSGKNSRCDLTTFTCHTCSGDSCDGDKKDD